MHRPNVSEAERLKRAIEQRLRQGKLGGIEDLERLTKIAKPGSEAYLFAHAHLGDELIECDPWRAALSLKVVIKARPFDDFAWGRMGLAMTLLENYHCAAAAYRRALDLLPGDPWYAHNLGHVLDVMLGLPSEALPFLQEAHRLVPGDVEIASSLAHTLARLGRLQEAKDVLAPFMRGVAAFREHRLLYRWIAAQMGDKGQRDQEQVAESARG